MIIIDTNVLSEPLKPTPAGKVLQWLTGQETLAVFTTTITMAELLSGVEALPAGKRRTGLRAAIERMLAQEFENRILPFNESAAREFAHILAARNAAGRPISQFDAMIAAVARSHKASLVTRNKRDFDLCGVHVIDPWTE